MYEVIETAMFPFLHVTGAVQNGFYPVDEGNASEQSQALSDFGGLFSERLCQPVKALSRSEDNAPVFPVLGDDFQHFRREVFRLVRAEPVLHFIDLDTNALNTVLIVDELTPMVQLYILKCVIQISDDLHQRIFLLVSKRLFHQRDGLSRTLTASKDNAPLILEIVGRAAKIVRHPLTGKEHKQIWCPLA